MAKDSADSQIKKLIDDNLKYTQLEDAVKALDIFHSQSPSLLSTKNVLPQIFENYDLNYEILSYKFITIDDDLAFVRLKQRTTKISGPAFRNNEIDMIQIYQLESGQWKLWVQTNLKIKFLEE